MSYIGIDIGTTGCKAVAFDAEGRQLASDYCEYPLAAPQPGWFELDPEQVLTGCRQVLGNVGKRLARSDPVRGIGISSQGEAFTCLNEHDKTLCPAMVSMDTRSTEEVRTFTTEFGLERLYQITGHSPHTLFSLFKLFWLRRNRPNIWSATHRILCFGDLLSYCLTGRAAISYNLAARTMLFDVTDCRWSPEILAALDLSDSILSKPVAADEPTGTLLPQMANELGLNTDVIVVPGGHDQSCGALGAGITTSHRAAYSLGTIECITPAFNTPVFNETMRRSNLAMYPHVVEGLYTTVAFNMTGGSLLRWYRDQLAAAEQTIAAEQSRDIYEVILSDLPQEPTSLIVQPHFASTGTPYFDPHSTGAIIGLNLATSRQEMIKALLEGVTYEMKLNLALLAEADIAVEQLHAFGGGVKSPAWLQIKADILQIPIATLEVAQAGCAGAAMLAAKACGVTESLDKLAQQWSRIQRVYEPNPALAEAYRERFEVYRQLYQQSKPLSAKLHAIKDNIPIGDRHAQG